MGFERTMQKRVDANPFIVTREDALAIFLIPKEENTCHLKHIPRVLIQLVPLRHLGTTKPPLAHYSIFRPQIFFFASFLHSEIKVGSLICYTCLLLI